jgi:hypothetical protein
LKRLLALYFLLSLYTISYGQSANSATGVYVSYGNIRVKAATGSDLITVTRAEVLAHTALTTSSPSIEVIGFTFSIMPNGGDIIGPYSVKGSRLSPEIVSKIQELSAPQSKIIIENIRAKIDGTPRSISPILLNMVLNKQ